MKRILTYSWGVFIPLFFLFLPFNYALFPAIGKYLSGLALPINQWVGEHLFHIQVSSDYISSDGRPQFILAFLLLLLSFFIALVLHKRFNKNLEAFSRSLHVIASYTLAFFLLKYGLDKLFLHQFYFPEPNTLHTPIGYLTKDILFWSSMGTSTSYNWFMGAIEIIPAFLLLHYKTRFIGAVISFGVLLNVFMINVGFDITVKLLSLYLLSISIFIIAPDIKRFHALLPNSTPQTIPAIPSPQRTKWQRGLLALVFLFAAAELMSPYIQSNSFNERSITRPRYHGSYSCPEGLTLFDIPHIRRIHLHKKNYLILENEQQEFYSFPVLFTETPSYTRIHHAKQDLILGKKESYWTLTLNNQTTSHVLHKIALKSLPLSDDSFHWTMEGLLQDDLD